MLERNINNYNFINSEIIKRRNYDTRIHIRFLNFKKCRVVSTIPISVSVPISIFRHHSSSGGPDPHAHVDYGS